VVTFFHNWKSKIPHLELQAFKCGKKALFPRRDFLHKPNKNQRKTTEIFVWKTGKFFQ